MASLPARAQSPVASPVASPGSEAATPTAGGYQTVPEVFASSFNFEFLIVLGYTFERYLEDHVRELPGGQWLIEGDLVRRSLDDDTPPSPDAECSDSGG